MLPKWYTHIQTLDGLRYTDRSSLQRLSFSPPIFSKTYPLLMEQQIPLLGYSYLLEQWCTQPPRDGLHRILNDPLSPISAQILSLQVLDCDPHIDSLPILWDVFLESRFAFRQEDPDLFERALDIIIKIEKKHPRSSQNLMQERIPQTFAKMVEHRDKEKIDGTTLKNLLVEYEEQYQITGIRAFASEEGSSFQSLINAARNKAPLPDLPVQPPGQYLDIPSPEIHIPSITQYRSSLSMPIWAWVILCFGSSFVLFRKRFLTKLSLLFFSLGIIISLETICMWAKITPLSESTPLFSLVDWKYNPYTKIKRGDKMWWVSNGGPARWQEIPVQKDVFRVGVLGASSAHGSNLLQEHTFASLLEKKLQQQYPKSSIQIVNLAVGGTTSNGVLYMGNQAIEMGCDALIIYYGHNEVAQFQQLTQLGGTENLNFRIWLSHSRIYALLHKLFPQRSSAPRIQLSAPTPQKLTKLAIRNHRYNISRLLEKTQKHNVPVLLISPTYNYRFAPATPSTQSFPQAHEWLQKAQESRPDNPKEALMFTKKAIKNDHSGGDIRIEALRMQAQLYARLQKPQKSRKAYQQLFDESLEISTIHSAIQQNIQDLAKSYGTSYLDATEVFYHHAHDGITANALFWDELHPSQKGHSYLAQAIYPWLEGLMEKK